MNKKYKIIIAILVAIFLVIQGNLFVKMHIYGHNADYTSFKKYKWIFKKNTQVNLDDIGNSTFSKTDCQNFFHYLGNMKNKDMGFLFNIWEFKNLENINLDKVKLTNDFDVSNITFKNGETLNMESELRQDVKYNYSFKDGFNINIDKKDTIKSYYKGKYYVGCYGNFKRISLWNEFEGHQIIIIKNDLKNPLTSILVYKRNKRLFLIIVQSDKYFDKDIIDVLNIGPKISPPIKTP